MRYCGSFIFICLSVFLLLPGLCHAGNTVIIGSTEQEVIKARGQPLGRAVSGNITILEYLSVIIQLEDNRVIELKDNKLNENTAINAGPAVKCPIIKKSLSRAKLSAKRSDKYKKIKVINSNGKKIDPDVLRVPNRINIVYFYANWCGLCSTMNPKIEKLARKYKNICLRKVNIINEHTPISKQFKIGAVPNIRVYDASGRIAVAPTNDFQKIKSCIENLMRH